MKMQLLGSGMFGSNSYLLEDNNEAVLIDAGIAAKDVQEALTRLNAKLKYIILTHGHIDHICTVDQIRDLTGASVLIHESDSDCLTRSDRNLSANFTRPHEYKKADKELVHGEIIKFGSAEIEVIHTPGHTMGGCCFLIENQLYSGDTLFAGSIGRTDFYGGDYKVLLASIKERLFVLPETTKVYPGHGNETTIGYEIKTNPFLK